MKTLLRKSSVFAITMLVVNLFFVGGVMGQTNTWDGSSSNSWNTGTNWSLGIVPTSAHDVIIPNSADYGTAPRIDVTPITIKSLTVGGGTNGTLEFNRSTSQSMTVTNNVVVNSGATFRMRTGGSLSGSSLLIGGNFTNSGTVDFVDVDVVNVTFNGTANQSVSGTGATMQLNNVTLNNTGAANNNIVEVSSTSFSPAAGFLTLTDGILKLSGNYTLSNTFFATTNYSIPTGTGLWLNNSNVTVTAQAASPSLSGLLRITSGAYNVGTSNNSMQWNNGSEFTMEGGTFNVAARFAPSSATSTSNITFTMSGGTLTTSMGSATTPNGSSSIASFDIPTTGTTASFNMSGGTIIMQKVASGIDFRMSAAGTVSITGGTVQFGNASTSGSPNFKVGTALGVTNVLPSLSVNATGTPTVTLNTAATIRGNASIATGTTFNANSLALTLSGNTVAPGNWTNNGTFTSGTQTTTFNGSATQTISGSSTTTFSSLTTNNAVGVNISSSTTVSAAFLATNTGIVNVTGGTTTLGAAATMTINPLATFKATTPGIADFAGKSVTIKSDATGTGAIGTITGTISNATNVTIERYVQARRAWRFLTAPIESAGAPTIKAAWMEGGQVTTIGATSNPSPGYGTHITGSTIIANGFDQNPAGNPSTKKTVNVWTGISNTLDPVTTEEGYMVFVRGSRANQLNLGVSAPLDITNLRVTGTLKQGTKTYTQAGTGSEAKTIGNPYASAITLPTTFAGNPMVYSVWDPLLTGSNSVGGFIQYSWNGFTYSKSVTPISPLRDGIVESGSAFILQYPDGVAQNTLTLGETDKTTGSVVSQLTEIVGEQMRINLNKVNPDATVSLQDGMLTEYDTPYSNSVDAYDAVKVTNFTQSMSSKRDGKKLAIERRAVIVNTDTTYLDLIQMSAGNYQLQLIADNLNHPSLLGKLVDNYTSSNTVLSLHGSSTYAFTVDANAGSFAADRFKVVYYAAAPLPVTFTSIKATQQNKNIAVEWQVANQVNISKYEVEKSTDGRHFTAVATQQPIGINGANATYNWLDVNAVTGDHFYRISSTGLSGDIKLSSIVKVTIGKGIPAIVVYPNPVVNNTVTLQFTDMPKGDYGTRLINMLGQTVQSKQLTHSGSNTTQSFAISQGIAKGNYQLQIITPAGEKLNQKIVITE